MSKVTDPALLAALNGDTTSPPSSSIAPDQSSGRVTDPALLSQLNPSDQSAQATGEADQARADAYRQHLSSLINAGASKDDIYAYARSMRVDPTQIKGLDEALARRATEPHAQIAVALAPSPNGPEITLHGADKGRGNAAITGVIDGLTLGFGDEAGGVLGASVNSLGNLVGLGNGKSWSDDYRQVRDDNREEIADAQYYHPGWYLGGQVGSAFLMPEGLLEKAGVKIGGGLIARGATDGAIYGGAYGAGSADGSLADRVRGGVEGTALGGGIGAIGGKAAEGLAALAPTKSAAAGREVLDAADRLSRDGIDVKPVPADVGGTLSRGLTGVARQGLFSNVPISRATNRYVDNVAGAASRAADSLSPGGSAADLGHTADAVLNSPGGLGAYSQAAKEAAQTQYREAADLAGNAKIMPSRTINTLDNLLDRWRSVPGEAPGMSKFENLREELSAGGPRSVSALRDLRTTFGDQFDVSNRTARDAAKTLWGPLSDDIVNGLEDQGLHRAGDAYSAADKAWATMKGNVNNVVKPVLGSKGQNSVEDIARNLVSMSRNDGAALDRTLSVMSPDMAGEVRASIVKELGRAKPGQQTADGEAFSTSSFLTNWSKLSEDGKNAILPVGTRARQDIEDIARVAQGARQAGRFNNHSNTGRVIDGLRNLGHFASGAGAIASLGKSFLGETAAGLALSSPTVAKGIVALGERRPIATTALRSLSIAPREQPAISTITGLNDTED